MNLKSLTILFTYLLVFGVGTVSLALVVRHADTPEYKLAGEWMEVSWDFEIVNMHLNLNDSTEASIFTSRVKQLTGNDLVIHRAETWQFKPDGTLILCGDDYQKTVQWRLKGRGHILQLKYDDGITESYNISELNDKRLVLHFDTDAQVRGIARLIFEKNTP